MDDTGWRCVIIYYNLVMSTRDVLIVMDRGSELPIEPARV